MVVINQWIEIYLIDTLPRVIVSVERKNIVLWNSWIIHLEMIVTNWTSKKFGDDGGGITEEAGIPGNVLRIIETATHNSTDADSSDKEITNTEKVRWNNYNQTYVAIENFSSDLTLQSPKSIEKRSKCSTSIRNKIMQLTMRSILTTYSPQFLY